VDKPGLDDLARVPHRRYNPLTDEWILVSPQRTQRPWQGQVEDRPPETRPTYDPECYLCPGNRRVGGAQNPAYQTTFVYDNDFPALLPDAPEVATSDGLLVARSERGICRVICFSPRHDLTLAELAPAELRQVVDVWAQQTVDLGARPFINHVQVFENRGAMMGSSNPHPHGQVWANEALPEEATRELRAQTKYLAEHHSCLLCDYLKQELESGQRIVCANEHFVALVPFWAVWPFETMVLSRRHARSIPELSDAERDALADILKRVTTRYDNLFKVSFPYTMGFHQAPTDDLSASAHPEWHLHAHFYPPLLRSATVRKFMVGYEMLANAQRDVTAEQAAERLRALSEIHYRAAR
jgi:UDPglucose--hexose-1-phosphate uridylyltransferase